jgi:hypothetical protein
MKVLYIAGSGRSGSTLLGRLLGQIDGFFSAGEAINIWDRGLVAGRRCGCGEPVPACPMWSAILADAFPAGTAVDPHVLSAMSRQRDHARSIVSMTARRVKPSAADPYLATLSRLYRSMERTTGCRVIVDSSKSPFYAEWLDRIADVYVVHLVRDPRAAAYSWLRKKTLPDFGDDRLMLQQSPFTSARRWSKAQALTELLWRRRPKRYSLLTYEALIRDPDKALRRATSLVDERSAALPLVDAHRAKIGMTHSVSGNPDRFQEGIVELRSDDEWRRLMRAQDRLVVTSVTWPLLLRYAYPIAVSTA